MPRVRLGVAGGGRALRAAAAGLCRLRLRPVRGAPHHHLHRRGASAGCEVAYSQSTGQKEQLSRCLQRGIRRVQDLCKVLQLPAAFEETAVSYFQRALQLPAFHLVSLEKKELLGGCCVLVTCRQHRWPLTMGTVCSLLYAKQELFASVFLSLQRELGLSVPALSLADLVTTHLSSFRLVQPTASVPAPFLEDKEKLLARTMAIVELASDTWLVTGRHPVPVVTAAAFLAWQSLRPGPRLSCPLARFCRLAGVELPPPALLRLRELLEILLAMASKLSWLRGLRLDKKTVVKHIGDLLQHRLFLLKRAFSQQDGQEQQDTGLGMGSVSQGCQGSVSQGSLDKDSVNKDSPGQGSVSQGSLDKDSVNKDSPSQDSVSQGSLDKDSMNKDSPGQGSVSQDCLGQDSTSQGSLNNGSLGKGSPGQGSVSQGSLDKDSPGQDSTSQGSVSQVCLGQGSVSQGSVGPGSLNKESVNKDCPGQDSPDQGSVGPGSLDKDSVNKDSPSQGSVGPGSLDKDSPGQGSLDKDSVNKDSSSQGSLDKDPPGQGSVSQGCPGQDSVSLGSLNKGSLDKGSPDQGSVGPGSLDKVSPGQDSTSQGSVSQVCLGQGSVGPGSLDKESLNKDSPGQDCPGQGSVGPGSLDKGSPGQGSVGPGSLDKDSPGQDCPGQAPPSSPAVPQQQGCPSAGQQQQRGTLRPLLPPCLIHPRKRLRAAAPSAPGAAVTGDEPISDSEIEQYLRSPEEIRAFRKAKAWS
ncbi:transcription factor IIIB 50 kDa subunit isoform X2 [Haemorhous mexicanus]|uniref:transcription factor IIIB 50 kDa subunit isoform X2 n=1 Tax=Haemorhous mexicanus TaxID=30427 RepID=UPI0028BD610E|nr:transcription factor IIIB 50 kDa subunit isoform X2 [Haemorhous mexicanus]